MDKEGGNTEEETIEDCRNECAKRKDVGYFSYKDGEEGEENCLCFFKSEGCPEENHNDDNRSAMKIFARDDEHTGEEHDAFDSYIILGMLCLFFKSDLYIM